MNPMANGDASGVLPVFSAPEFSDEDLALKFTSKHADELRYTALFARWNLWTGKFWRPDETMQIFSLARQLCREQAEECYSKARANTPSKESKAIASAKTVAAVINLARSDRRHAATKDQWDANPWDINTTDGIIDLKSCDLVSHDPRSYCTVMTPVGPGENCDLWMQFLNRIMNGDAELIGFLQRMAGYCLTGLTTEHAVFFLYGTGANGKSVFISTLMGIMGDYARVAPIDIFMETKGDRHPTELAMLNGARLVTAIETEEGRRWNESRLKALTGGDKINARFMRQDFFEFIPQFKLVIAGNHRPSLRSVDEAIKRRMNLIPFNVTIPKEERDPDLAEKLKAEWPGILSWMLAGCSEWQRRGIDAPEKVKAATEEYLSNEDVFAAWLEECCDRDGVTFEAGATLYRSYTQWCDGNAESKIGKRRFNERLVGAGADTAKSGSARGFRGLNLRVAPYASSHATEER